MINHIDRDAFIAVLRKYGVDYFGGGLSLSVVDNMINSHVNGKEHIFKLFGNKLKVEKEIETTVNFKVAKQIRTSLVEELSGDKLIFVRGLLKAIPIKDFIENQLSDDYYICNVKLNKGLKLSKALGKLCLKEDVHRVVTAHSMVNQKLFVKGKAVLSIDPIDYLTMSSNSSGWKSCHRLNGGEYCTGPLAYINDSSSVICYIESSTPCEFIYQNKEYKHSNKTWRQIALVSPELEYALQERQYPATNSINSNAISEMFIELFNKHHKTDAYTYTMEETYRLKDLHVDYGDEEDAYRMYYNDIDNEMFEEGAVIFNKSIFKDVDALLCSNEKDLPLKGESVACLDCGNELCDTESLYCEDCHNDYDDDDDDY